MRQPPEGRVVPDGQALDAAVRAAEHRLSRPGLAPLVDALARRFCDGDSPVRVTLRGLSAAHQSALADLLGSDRLPRADAHVRVDALVNMLGLANTDALRDVVDHLRGPLPDRRAERNARKNAREALWSWLAEQAAIIRLDGDGDTVAPAPWVAPWVEAQRTAGVRGDLAAHRRRLELALTVLRALPANGASLAGLANDTAGDPHALDHGRALATTVLDAVAAAQGIRRPPDAEGTRALWESTGVAPDPLSSTVLVVGLPGGFKTPLDRWLAAASDAGEPVVLSLANLRRWPPAALPMQSVLYVVENPSLVAEAAANGWKGPPLVCSSGRPTVATVTLLRHLTASGARAFQHADFDAAGLAITDWLARRAGTIPWRMDAANYLHALGMTPSRQPFTGGVPTTPWDPALRGVIERERAVVYEEQLREALWAAMRTCSR